MLCIFSFCNHFPFSQIKYFISSKCRYLQNGLQWFEPQAHLCIKISKNISTLGLNLGFSAELRIWQVPACKMEPRSGINSCKNRPDQTRPDHPAQFAFNVVRCPHPINTPHQQSMCGVPPPSPP